MDGFDGFDRFDRFDGFDGFDGFKTLQHSSARQYSKTATCLRNPVPDRQLLRHGVCTTPVVGAKTYRELLVWQLGDALRTEVCRLTAVGSAAHDFEFRSQLRDAASSIPSNLAEGFRRSSSADYARFVTYAFTSLDETEDRLRDGLARGHWTTEQLDAAWRLIRRMTPALRNFRSYLLTDEARRRSRDVYSARRRRPESNPSDQ